MKGIALDIDNTLSATNLVWTHEMIERFGNPENLSPEEIATRYIMPTEAPFWQSEEVKEWTKRVRESDPHHDAPLLENANHIVNKIHADIPIKAYITGRWEVLREGTEAWLWRHDFPRAPVYMRPMNTEHLTTNSWKAPFLESMYPEIAGIIDDDPRLLEFLSDEYKGTVFLYKNTKHIETPVEVIECADWERTEKAVREKYA